MFVTQQIFYNATNLQTTSPKKAVFFFVHLNIIRCLSPKLGFRNPRQLFVNRSTMRGNCELPFRIHRNYTLPFSHNKARLITAELPRKPSVSFGRSDRLCRHSGDPRGPQSVLAGRFIRRGSQIISTCAVLTAQPAVNHLERLLSAVSVVSALFFHEERSVRILFRKRGNYVNRMLTAFVNPIYAEPR